MGECCSTKSYAEDTLNQMELFEAKPVPSQGRERALSPCSKRHSSIVVVDTEQLEEKSEDGTVPHGQRISQRFKAEMKIPHSVANSNLASPILTNRGTFNNTMRFRQSLFQEQNPPLFSPTKDPQVQSYVKRANVSFVDIADSDLYPLKEGRIENEEAPLSAARTVDILQKRGKRGIMADYSTEGGSTEERRSALQFRGLKSDRNSVYVQGSFRHAEERPRTQSQYLFQNHNSVTSEQMAIDVFS